MTASGTATSLHASVAQIADHVLDQSDYAALTLDDKLRTRCAAALVLGHAEIEQAIEDACLGLVDTVDATPIPTVAILAWGLGSGDGTSSGKRVHSKMARAGGAVRLLTAQYRDLVASNHGVRKCNLERLLIPLGVDLKPLTADLEALDGFGAYRGSVAHKSPLKMQLQESPTAVRSRVVTAAKAAEAVVSAIAALRTPGVTPPVRQQGWLRRLIPFA